MSIPKEDSEFWLPVINRAIKAREADIKENCASIESERKHVFHGFPRFVISSSIITAVFFLLVKDPTEALVLSLAVCFALWGIVYDVWGKRDEEKMQDKKSSISPQSLISSVYDSLEQEKKEALLELYESCFRKYQYDDPAFIGKEKEIDELFQKRSDAIPDVMQFLYTYKYK